MRELSGFSVVEATGLAPMKDPATLVAASELVLEGLVAKKMITSTEELGYARAAPERPPPFGSAGNPNTIS